MSQIDKDALWNELERVYEHNNGNVCWNDALLAIEAVPVARGHKVTHNRPIAGHWISGILDGGLDGMEGRVWVEPIMDNPVDYCSECGKRLDDTFQNFCPYCGVRIVKEGEEHETD